MFIMQYLKNISDNVYNMWENKTGSFIVSNGNTIVEKSNELVLYYNYYSYYSQKVLMALHEKGLQFSAVEVDITRGEQYESWFLDLNPRGEVPVLRDHGRHLCDSTRILNHLESTAYDHPLENVTTDEKLALKIQRLRDLLDAMPVGVITMGSFYHQDLCGQPKIPFILSVRNALKKAEGENASNLRKLAEQHPSARGTLLYKAEIHDRKHELLADREEYIKVLDQVEAMLTIVETELESQPEGNWLCCETFTLADISLTVLLERLYVLGLEDRFWSHNKKTHVQQYYDRVRQRASYKASIPNIAFHFKIMILSQPPPVIAVITAGSISGILTILYITKKIIFS